MKYKKETILLLRFLKEENIRERYFSLMKPHLKDIMARYKLNYINYIDTNIIKLNPIVSYFPWIETNEGFNYWEKMSGKYIKFLAKNMS